MEVIQGLYPVQVDNYGITLIIYQLQYNISVDLVHYETFRD